MESFNSLYGEKNDSGRKEIWMDEKEEESMNDSGGHHAQR